MQKNKTGAPTGQGAVPTPKPVLEMRGVTKKYLVDNNPVTVVDQANLTVNAGEIVWLAGPSGAGKTTVIRMAGLLATPEAGTVTIAGQTPQTTAQRDRARATHIGIVFQTAALIEHLTVAQNLRIAALENNPASIRAALENYGISHLQNSRASTISTGEAQRTAFARATINKPRLLLADEPTSALDEDNAQQILTVLQKQAQQGSAILVTSHDPRVGRIAHRTVNIDEIQAGNGQ